MHLLSTKGGFVCIFNRSPSQVKRGFGPVRLWYTPRMKPASAPEVPGNTEAEKFDNAVRKIFRVSKEELLKREAKWKRTRAKKKKLAS